MHKEIILKSILEDYGLSVSVKQRKYILDKPEYWFEVKMFDLEKDQAYMNETEFENKRWIVFNLFNDKYSIITNMSHCQLMDFQVSLHELLY